MKKLRIAFIIVTGLFLYSLALSSITRVAFTHPDKGSKYFGKLPELIIQLTDIGKNIKGYIYPEYIKKNNKDSDGFTYTDTTGILNSYQILVSYKTERYKGIFELYNLLNGNIIKKWEPDNEEIYRQVYNPENPRRYPKGTDFNNLHPLLLDDNSIVYNVEHAGLIKIDQQGDPVWIKNDRIYHHSIEQNTDGFLFISTQPYHSRQFSFLTANYESYKNALMDDEISMINPTNGEIIFNKSVIEILLENGFEELLLNKGQFTYDPIHLNDIQPAKFDSNYWNIGDLLISARNLSVVLLYRPSTNKILWLKQGPWLNQHDVDFLDSTTISVFSNSVIRLESFKKGDTRGGEMFFRSDKPHNEIYFYNFRSDSISTPYSEMMKKEKISTATAGRSEILSNGDVFIEETNSARIVVGDSKKAKISFVKRIDDEHITHLNWSRILPKN